MKQRSNSYLRTFPNTVEGNLEYKQMVLNIRKVITGGRFLKMFRGNKRRMCQYGRCGSSPKEGATHFDCYLFPRNDVNPKLFNLVINPYGRFTITQETQEVL